MKCPICGDSVPDLDVHRALTSGTPPGTTPLMFRQTTPNGYRWRPILKTVHFTFPRNYFDEQLVLQRRLGVDVSNP